MSRTLDVVDKAGRARETAYQQMLKGIELRRDIEGSLTGFTGVQIKKGTDPREMASFPAFVGTYLGGATGTAPAGDGSTAPGAGTARALSLTLLGDAMEACYNKGGHPETLLVNSHMKRAISALINTPGSASAEYHLTTAEQAVIIGAVSKWVGDFGEMNIVPSRFMPNNTIYGVDWDYVTVCPLPSSNFVTEELAKIGDADNGMVVWEGTLRVDAPNAHFILADIS